MGIGGGDGEESEVYVVQGGGKEEFLVEKAGNEKGPGSTELVRFGGV